MNHLEALTFYHYARYDISAEASVSYSRIGNYDYTMLL